MSEHSETSRKGHLWLEIATPTKLELRQEVDFVVAPTVKGSIGILPGHIHLMTLLSTGILRFRAGTDWRYLAVSDGYMEVTPTKVIVLAEVADLPDEIDIEEALAEKRRAEEELHRRSSEKVDFTKARVNLERALLKLNVAKKYGDYREEREQ